MKILFIGTRGIPANYSGFEICVQEVAKRLQDHHQIIVYARKGHYKTVEPKKLKILKLYIFLA